MDIRTLVRAMIFSAALMLVPPALAQRGPAVPLFEGSNQISRTLVASVSGYRTADYAFDASAGDHVAIKLTSSNRHLYFNLMPPQGEATYDGSIGGDRRFETTLQQGGRYVVSVYFMRNDARRGASAEFLLNVTRTPAGTETAHAASFDCRRAATAVERTVCSMPELVMLDSKLADAYRAALDAARGKGNEAQLREQQRDWLVSRNACITADDSRQCLKDAYQTRIAFLEVRYGLVGSKAAAAFDCGPGEPPITATFFPTDPASVRLERGHDDLVAVEGMSGSGARYAGERGLVFWNNGRDAAVEWPGAGSLRCTTR